MRAEHAAIGVHLVDDDVAQVLEQRGPLGVVRQDALVEHVGVGHHHVAAGADGLPRIAGRAFTLRFVPAREDLATPASWGSPISTRAAIEAMPEGCIAVVGALGCTNAGIFGDILCARMQKRGVAALVSDGVVRDVAGVLATGLPVWCQGTAAPPSVAGLTFVGWQEPIDCGGVAVFPNDVIVVDQDGAVLIPSAMLDDITAAAFEQERQETWIMDQVQAGAALPGLYPPNADNQARYAAWVKGQG
jgi:regulator of RNase E activity RraA